MRAWVFAASTGSSSKDAGEPAPEEVLETDTATAIEEKPVEAALVDFDRDVQTRALDALLATDRTQAIHTLVRLTHSEDAVARLQSLALLYESDAADGATVVFALGAALRDKHLSVREYAVEALATRTEPEAVGYLERAFGDADAKTRIRILENIGEFPHGRPLLERALRDSDESVRSVARGFLGEGSPGSE
jgi:HEAT repeat protein